MTAAAVPQEWQPMATAPKDGQIVWAWLKQSGIREVLWVTAEEFAEIEGGSADDFEAAWVEAFEDLERGGIVGTATIVDCVERSSSPWFFGRFGFVLENAEPLPQIIPVKGALGFFKWRDQMTTPAQPAAPIHQERLP